MSLPAVDRSLSCDTAGRSVGKKEEEEEDDDEEEEEEEVKPRKESLTSK